MTTPQTILKQYFGYDSFRPQQEEIITTLLSGQDVMVLMPTGGGKSLCYQIPAMMKSWVTIVISPLIALMYDQVEALKANGINAVCLNSSQKISEQTSVLRQVESGEVKMLYISPEKLFSDNILSWISTIDIAFFAVDEAHCISSWGHEFRSEYRKLGNLKSHFPNLPIIALTATADATTRRDILTQLSIPDAQVFLSSFDRPNLSLTVLPGRKRIEQIEEFLTRHRSESGIIYCLSRKTCESVSEKLQEKGYKVAYYHAGMPSEERMVVQDAFLKDDVEIIVATVAFGMGIDKSNVRFVIHYNIPSNMEWYYQEIGRAGRDGEPSDTILFSSISDIISRREMIEKSEVVALEQKILMQAKLDRMVTYAESNICRRRVLLSYFQESLKDDCGNCDVCRNPRTTFDATILVQKALSVIARTNQGVTMKTVIEILRWSQAHHILQAWYHDLPTFWLGRDYSYDQWESYLSEMLNAGMVYIAYDQGHALKLNERSKSILSSKEQVFLSEYVSPEERRKQEDVVVSRTKKRDVIRDELFEELRKVRKALSEEHEVPPFIIFSDATLSDMAQKKPIDERSMLQVSWVGQEKYRRFGEVFIDAIKAFARKEMKEGRRIVPGITHQETLELYNMGFSIDAIASNRWLKPSTILSHLFKLREEWHVIDLRKLIDDEAFAALSEGIRTQWFTQESKLREIYDYFEGKYSYDEIRVVMTLKL